MNIDDLLQSERRRGGFSEEERAAMWHGIERSVTGAGAAAAAAAPAAKAAPAVAKAATAKIATWKLGAMLAAAAIGGMAIGAAVQARWGQPKIIEVERPSPLPTIAPVTTPTVVASASEVQTAKPIETQAPAPREIVRHGPAPNHTVSPPKDPSLARERTLLDMARTALSRGDAPAALASLDTHAREFPSSQFGPEREVLAIQALAAANRAPEARKRAAAFRASYPKSSLLPIVDEVTKPANEASE